jgi:DNA processing protein
MNNDLFYKIALTFIPNVGAVLAKNLVAYCGSAEAVFKQNKKQLQCIPEIGPITAKSILKQEAFMRAEKEIERIKKNNIEALFFTDNNYPFRLKQCHDSPILIYKKGNTDLNKHRYLAVVGTRNASVYGKKLTCDLIDNCIEKDIIIVSGMAFGIDITAHRQSIKNNIPTIAVLGHGLDIFYPSQHKETALAMLDNGSWLSEYPFETAPDRENFPSRNRIVAGMCDAVVVVEAAKKGGALITADIANSYSRDVFTFPGRIGDTFSEGCNNLIKYNQGALITSANDIFRLMNWEDNTKKKNQQIQKSLFIELTPEEEKIVEACKLVKTIDEIAITALLPISKTSSILFSLEMKGLIRVLPGKEFELI